MARLGGKLAKASIKRLAPAKRFRYDGFIKVYLRC